MFNVKFIFTHSFQVRNPIYEEGLTELVIVINTLIKNLSSQLLSNDSVDDKYAIYLVSLLLMFICLIPGKLTEHF